MALLEGVARASGLIIPDAALRKAAEETQIAVDAQLEDSTEGTALVRSLEEKLTTLRRRPVLCRLADELGAELERFLASQPRPEDPSV